MVRSGAAGARAAVALLATGWQSKMVMRLAHLGALPDRFIHSPRHRPATDRQSRHPVMACQFFPGLVKAAVAATLVPFMVQITGVPSVFWNRRSALPSPL